MAWSAELRPVEGLPDEICFDRLQYQEEFASAVARVRELPFDEKEHKLRRFLWRWQWGWRLPRAPRANAASELERHFQSDIQDAYEHLLAGAHQQGQRLN